MATRELHRRHTIRRWRGEDDQVLRRTRVSARKMPQCRDLLPAGCAPASFAVTELWPGCWSHAISVGSIVCLLRSLADFRELYEEVVAGESTLLVDESGFAVRLLRVGPSTSLLLKCALTSRLSSATLLGENQRYNRHVPPGSKAYYTCSAGTTNSHSRFARAHPRRGAPRPPSGPGHLCEMPTERTAVATPSIVSTPSLGTSA